MIYEVSRFGYLRVEPGEIKPGWQTYFLVANSPEDALEKARPLMEAQAEGKFATADPLTAKPAQCAYHRRYLGKGPPKAGCGTCHAMRQAALAASQAARREGSVPHDGRTGDHRNLDK